VWEASPTPMLLRCGIGPVADSEIAVRDRSHRVLAQSPGPPFWYWCADPRFPASLWRDGRFSCRRRVRLPVLACVTMRRRGVISRASWKSHPTLESV
jgi:hypothetical protein